jgi:flavin reductase (DIM6/NTAB) family NADH-FMN oxidoreductase RutF
MLYFIHNRFMDNVIPRECEWDGAVEGSVPPRAFRQALGRFGSGVTVLSVAHAQGYHGMTANAFMSISLDPPLVAVSIGRKARINEHLRKGTCLGISVLAQDQQALALHFGGRPDARLDVDIRWADGVPLIAAAGAQFVAAVDQIHEAGDHRIFVARLRSLRWSDAAPLLFWAGGFGDYQAREAAPVHSTVPDFWC